ncbi:unnamed protein product [Gordionus sp. m RMFG-2023]|uniref:deoxyribodipyrimidine photo-lyase-like n=1 Tax=Gordionus sp. m RMFG-2023 TaxID=3053472 RepID=UPI0030E391F4
MIKFNSIFWFRKDLRLHDNPGLWHSVKDSENVICLYIYQDETVKQAWPIGSAQKWWLHHSLASLSKSINENANGIDATEMKLLIKNGDPIPILKSIFKGDHVKSLYFNKVYEPHYVKQDKLITEMLEGMGVTVRSFNASLLLEPDVIRNKTGGYFKVFTPYWRTCLEYLFHLQRGSQPRKLYDRPCFNVKHISKLIASIEHVIKSDSLSHLSLLPTHPDWAGGLRDTWKPGELRALERLRDFLSDGIKNYDSNRDNPHLTTGTSRLSPHLALGEIGPWQIWHAIFPSRNFDLKGSQGKEKYLAECGWREFSYYLLHHFPEFPSKNFRTEFDRFQWSPSQNEPFLKAWKSGLTGYPIVDAGMKQLWHEGYMHNRVRMITASFLTKDLLIDWRVGAAWFWDTLVDADLANNSSGWQWVAGTGADASPYFRIFNPTLQGEKFDAEGLYVKKWIPALAKVPLKYIHQPWKCPRVILDKCGIELVKDYPMPIVDHEKCRLRALQYYANLKIGAKSVLKSHEDDDLVDDVKHSGNGKSTRSQTNKIDSSIIHSKKNKRKS